MNYKEIVIRLLKQKNINEAELNFFILEYIKSQERKEPSAKQLQKIKQLLYAGQLSIEYAALEAARLLDLRVTTLINMATKQIIKKEVF